LENTKRSKEIIEYNVPRTGDRKPVLLLLKGNGAFSLLCVALLSRLLALLFLKKSGKN
jgi:hypothetical protein